jgi:AraC-like DNA-binding protein/mannose-6-phosphate isomerase-like protein (cupin superfamily)
MRSKRTVPDCGESFRDKVIAVLTRCGAAAASGRVVLHVPKARGLSPQFPEPHYHPVAEFFIQLSGTSEMRFPNERIVIRPGECLLVPPVTPHAERVCPPEETFCNLVFYFRHLTVTTHEARAGELSIPRIAEGLEVPCTNEARLAGYLNAIVEAIDAQGAGCAMTVNGLLQAYMGSLIMVLQQPAPWRHQSAKVLECRRLVDRCLTDAALNVERLAKRVGCAPDYLSHRFHLETGVTITSYIGERRIAMAKSLLEQSNLNIAQIAYACGYRDPGYFTRQFRQRMAVTPRSYRESRREPEPLP